MDKKQLTEIIRRSVNEAPRELPFEYDDSPDVEQEEEVVESFDEPSLRPYVVELKKQLVNNRAVMGKETYNLAEENFGVESVLIPTRYEDVEPFAKEIVGELMEDEEMRDYFMQLARIALRHAMRQY